MKRTFRFLAGIALIAAPVAANAACPPGTFPDPNDPNVCYNASTELNLDGDEIGGELLGPDGAEQKSRLQGSYSSLIQIRENFMDEMLKSAEDL